ncbi:MAG: glycosyltransferase family 2 protein [Candidatus Thermoplasmatota archaeon]|nr:glycosyltransferase family 2 protein [Candidatus Thermoplasmatota archaeon]
MIYRYLILISAFTTLIYFLYYALNAYYLMKHTPEYFVNESSGAKDVTILVPVYNERVDVFERVIQGIKNQGTRFVVVGDSSNEPYRSIVERNGGTFVYLSERGGKRIAISEGMKYVDTKFVLFVDSDTSIPVATVNEMLTHFKDNVGGVGANVSIRRTDSGASYSAEFLERTREVILKAMTVRGGSVMVIDGKCAMYRTSIVKPLLTSDKFRYHKVAGKIATMGDDQQLTAYLIKKGYKATKCFEVVVETEPPENFKQFAKQSIRWARSSYYYFLKNLTDGTAIKAGGFYAFEAISTFALPILTLGLGAFRLYISLDLLGTFAGNSFDTVLDLVMHPAILLTDRAIIHPMLDLLSLPGPLIFGSAVVMNVRRERVRTLAYGGLALIIIFFTSIYGFLTCWKQSKWMTR